MMALARLLATLHDDEGNVAVAGVTTGRVGRRRVQSGGSSLPAPTCCDGVQLVGTGSVASRLWAKPSIYAIGIDMTQHRRFIERPDP